MRLGNISNKGIRRTALVLFAFVYFPLVIVLAAIEGIGRSFPDDLDAFMTGWRGGR